MPIFTVETEIKINSADDVAAVRQIRSEVMNIDLTGLDAEILSIEIISVNPEVQ